MFAGGIIPGIIMGISLMGFIYFLSLKKGKFPKPENKASLKQNYYSFIRAFPSLLSPAIIVGGILLGIMTPTEAACVAVVYSILLSIIYKNFSLKYLIYDGIETAKVTGNVLFIFSTANFFAWVLARERIPQLLVSLLLNTSSNPSVVIFCIITIGLIVGCFMEGIASMIILVPVFVPIMNSLHLDLVHMGMVIIITMMLGSLTPPFGAGLFATAQVAEISYERMVKAAIPFLIPLYIALLITAYVPTTVTFLSNLFAR
jgi:tripartite ATP-independent transporter DctM subunit